MGVNMDSRFLATVLRSKFYFFIFGIFFLCSTCFASEYRWRGNDGTMSAENLAHAAPNTWSTHQVSVSCYRTLKEKAYLLYSARKMLLEHQARAKKEFSKFYPLDKSEDIEKYVSIVLEEFGFNTPGKVDDAEYKLLRDFDNITYNLLVFDAFVHYGYFPEIPQEARKLFPSPAAFHGNEGYGHLVREVHGVKYLNTTGSQCLTEFNTLVDVVHRVSEKGYSDWLNEPQGRMKDPGGRFRLSKRQEQEVLLLKEFDHRIKSALSSSTDLEWDIFVILWSAIEPENADCEIKNYKEVKSRSGSVSLPLR